MGVVYRAQHLLLKRVTAIKMMSASAASDLGAVKRFEREAQAMSRVVHPNLLKVFEVGEAGDVPFIAMELVEGSTLAATMRNDPVSLRRRADQIFEQIAEAVGALHAAGITHRDLKPSNVMITPEWRPVVMDLGLVKDHESAGTILTRTGAVVGTPAFMAPEVLQGQPATTQSDVWALGCLYWCLHAGVPPFRGATLTELFENIVHLRLPAPETVLLEASPERHKWVQRVLSLAPESRPKDARRALEAFRRGHGRVSREVRAGPASPAKLPPPAPGRAGLVAALAVAIAGAGAVWMRLPSPVAPPSPVEPATPSVAQTPSPVHTPPKPVAWTSLLCAGWDEKYEERLAALKQPGPNANRMKQELAHLTKLSMLDSSSAPWIRWLQLGWWLARGAEPDKLPLMLRKGEGKLELNDVNWSLGLITSTKDHMLTMVCGYPDLVRGWAMLGLLIEEEGRPEIASRVFAVARERELGPEIPPPWPRRMVAALVRAYRDQPGELERRLPLWLKRSDVNEELWDALLQVVASVDVARCEALMSAHGGNDDVFHSARARLLMLYKRQPAEAEASLRKAIAVSGDSATLRDPLLHVLLERGDVDGYRQALVRNPALAQLRSISPLLEDATLTDDAMKFKPGDAEWHAVARLECRIHRDGAPAIADVLAQAATYRRVRATDALVSQVDRPGGLDEIPRFKGLVFDMLARGFSTPELTAVAKRVSASPDDATLSQAVRLLVTPAGEPWMTALIANATPKLGASGLRDHLMLWHSRCGRHADALAIAEAADSDTVGQRLTEVGARPVWEAAQGKPVDAAVLERARALLKRCAEARAFRTETSREYLLAVAEGRLDEAAMLGAAIAERVPECDQHVANAAWAYKRTGRNKELAALRRQLRARCVRDGSLWPLYRAISAAP